MIAYAEKPARHRGSPKPAGVERVVVRHFDEASAMVAHLKRLVALIDEKAPQPRAADRRFTEHDAAALIAHFQEFERAKFSCRFVNGSLYGLRLAGISSSSTSCQQDLLFNWRRAAALRIEQTEAA